MLTHSVHLLSAVNLAGFTVIACWHRVPLLGQGHHGARIEHTEPKEVIELQPDAVHCPVESVLGIEQGIALRC